MKRNQYTPAQWKMTHSMKVKHLPHEKVTHSPKKNAHPAREGDAREGDAPKKHGDIGMTMVSKRLGTEVGTITKHTTKITIERIVDRSRSPIRVTTQTHVVEEAERIA